MLIELILVIFFKYRNVDNTFLWFNLRTPLNFKNIYVFVAFVIYQKTLFCN